MKNHVSVVSRIFFVTVLVWPLGQNTILAAEDQPATTAEKAIVVTRVNGIEITEQMVLKEIDRIVRESGQRLPPAQLAQKERLFFRNGLERATNFALLTSVARLEGITVDTDELDQSILNLRKRVQTEEQFNQALASQGLNENQLRRILKENLLPQKVLETKVKKRDAPTDEAIQTFYTQNPKFFVEPEQVKAGHILLRVQPASSDEDKETIKNKILSIRADIENNKISFEEAAKQHSEDPGSAVRGGDLDYFARGRMVKPFEDVAFSTPVGEIGDLVESQFGFHLIRVADHKKERQVPLEDVKEKIQSFLAQRDQQEATKQYLSTLREAAKIETLMSEEQWNARHIPKNAIQVNPSPSKEEN